MATEGDNLDARMEAIRIKNEELEKKHKEIMEDELLAKLENAVVDVKKKSDSVSSPHPYDNLELDFDVSETDKEMAKNPDFKPKNRRPPPRNDLLDEIPPDPVNFLREDGDETAKLEPNQAQRPPNKNRNFNRNRQDRPRTSNNEDDPNSGDSPPRPRNNQNNRPRPPQQYQQQNRSPQDGNAPRRQIHPQQLRNERRMAPAQNDDYRPQSGQSPQNQANRQRRPNNRQPNKEGGDRNNITVQLDGEVRSVKLKATERTFGSGRVGHARPDNRNDNRPDNRHDNRPENRQFTVDTFDPESPGDNPRQERSPQDKPRNRNPRNARRNPKPKEFQHPTLENMIIPKASVQDRLARIHSKDAADVEVQAQPEVLPVAITSNEEVKNGD